MYGQSESTCTPPWGLCPSLFFFPDPTSFFCAERACGDLAESVVECKRPREPAREELRSLKAVKAKQAGQQVIWEQRV